MVLEKKNRVCSLLVWLVLFLSFASFLLGAKGYAVPYHTTHYYKFIKKNDPLYEKTYTGNDAIKRLGITFEVINTPYAHTYAAFQEKDCSTITLEDGRVLIIYAIKKNLMGDDTYPNLLFDPKTKTFEEININIPKYKSISLDASNVFLAEEVRDKLDGGVFNIDKKQYTEKFSNITNKSFCSFYKLLNKKILIHNSHNLLILDTEKWLVTDKIIRPSFLHLEEQSDNVTILLPNGELLFIGGDRGGAINSSSKKEIVSFNPDKREFKVIGNLIHGRAISNAFLVDNNKIIVTGGIAKGGSIDHNSIELFDLKTNKSEVIGHLQFLKGILNGQMLDNGMIMLNKGSNIEIYDYKKKEHYVFTSPVYTVMESSTIKLKNGDIFMFGGLYAPSLTRYENKMVIMKFRK